jgi:hypothetical protein
MQKTELSFLFQPHARIHSLARVTVSTHIRYHGLSAGQRKPEYDQNTIYYATLIPPQKHI